MTTSTVRDDDRPDVALEQVRRALVDDLDAGFGELVEAHRGALYSVALRVTGKRVDAEDLVGDTLLRAYRALRSYTPERREQLNPRPWLLTILVNTRRNYIRDADRRPRPSGSPVPDRCDAGPSVEEQAIRRETNEHLGSLLRRLSEVQRAAVVLRHVVDLPINHVADILGCPLGTAKSHVSRGLGHLRVLMAEDEAGTGTTAVRGAHAS